MKEIHLEGGRIWAGMSEIHQIKMLQFEVWIHSLRRRFTSREGEEILQRFV